MRIRGKGLTSRALLFVLLLGFASIPAFAGSAVVGSVAGSMNATLGGQPLLPNSAIFSGDSLKVKDGATVIALASGSRLVFGRETEARFLREGNGVTVLLGEGSVSVYHPEGSAEVRVKANNVSIAPAPGFKTLGEVAMLNGAIVVTSKEGSLRVEGNGSPVEVATGKTVTIGSRTARAPRPQGAGGQGLGGGGSTALEAGALGAGAAAAILAGIGISRANDARDAANAANATAAKADADAVAAANTADADAKAATDAANTAAADAVAVGCALNNLSDQLGTASPYTPPSGTTCPPFSGGS